MTRERRDEMFGIFVSLVRKKNPGTQNLITREEKMEEKILHLIGNTSIQMSLGAWWRNVLILCNYHFIQSELLFLF